MSSNPAHDEVYSIQHFVIKFISDLRQVGVFPGTPVSSTNKTDRHDITEILLKVTLNTIPLSQYVKIFLHLWFSFPLKCAGLNKHHAKNTRMLNQSITWLATYVWQFTKMTKMLNQCITDLWFALPKKWVLCCGMNYSPVGDNCCSLQHCWCIEYHIWVTIITNYHTTVPTNVEQMDNTGEPVFCSRNCLSFRSTWVPGLLMG